MTFYYMAAPLTHPEQSVRDARAKEARRYAVALMRCRLMVFDPIGMTEAMCKEHDMPHTFDFWDAFNVAFISQSAGIIVAEIEGWRESKGVAHELRIARNLELPITYAFIGADGVLILSPTASGPDNNE